MSSPAYRGSQRAREGRQNAIVAEQVAEHAQGALAAQKAVAAIRDGSDPALAFIRLNELAERLGPSSPVIWAFVLELAKRAAR